CGRRTRSACPAPGRPIVRTRFETRECAAPRCTRADGALCERSCAVLRRAWFAAVARVTATHHCVARTSGGRGWCGGRRIGARRRGRTRGGDGGGGEGGGAAPRAGGGVRAVRRLLPLALLPHLAGPRPPPRRTARAAAAAAPGAGARAAAAEAAGQAGARGAR